MIINNIEKIIIKSALSYKDYIALITNSFRRDYFDDDLCGVVFEIISNHFREFGSIVPRDTIGIEIDKNYSTLNDLDDVARLLEEIDSIEFDVIGNYQYLVKITNDYLKEKAIKKAILETVDIINKKSSTSTIKSIIEDALCKDLNVDLGLNYFGNFKERIQHILDTPDIRVPTYFPQLDEYLNGGFPYHTLSVIMAKIHGFKSNFIVNLAARQVLFGHVVVIITLEMSEQAYAQRLDAIYSKIDINKIYRNKQMLTKMAAEVRKVREQHNIGMLYIKQFPTGQASVMDFSKYLRELRMRGIVPSIVYVDYINLIKPSYGAKKDLYSDVKGISEELRALSYEFLAPIVSVTQLNREGSQLPFSEVDFTYVSECLSLDSIVFKWDGKIYVEEKILNIRKDDVILGNNCNVNVEHIFGMKTKKMYKIKTKNGKEIVCSDDHKFPTSNGIKSIKTGLNIGSKLRIL